MGDGDEILRKQRLHPTLILEHSRSTQGLPQGALIELFS